MQNKCLEKYDVKALLFCQVAWSPFLDRFWFWMYPSASMHRVISGWYLQKL